MGESIRQLAIFIYLPKALKVWPFKDLEQSEIRSACSRSGFPPPKPIWGIRSMELRWSVLFLLFLLCGVMMVRDKSGVGRSRGAVVGYTLARTEEYSMSI